MESGTPRTQLATRHAWCVRRILDL